MPFPLPFLPRLSWKTGGRRFGADRDGGRRKHAACDLVVPDGTPVIAVADGVVIEVAPFYRGTFSVAVRHAGFVARYCEVRQALAPGVRPNAVVKAGQTIAFVGRMFKDSMLHFEMYAGTLHTPLSVTKNKPFSRRADLIDPTAFLDRMSLFVSMSHGGFGPTASAGSVG